MGSNRRISEFIVRRLSRKRWQSLWERLYMASLNGMGIGAPTLPLSDSGEDAALREILRELAPDHPAGLVCFDVGANTGQYAALLAQLVPKGSQIYSFEPSTAAFELLVRNCEGLSAVHPHRLALGAEAGSAVLSAPRPGDVTGSILPDETAGSKESVPVETLDAFCEERHVSRIHYLKIDTEGTELDVLRGAHQLLAREAIDAVQWEFGAGSLQAASRLKDFLDLLPGYELHRVVGDGLYRIAYSPKIEIYHSAANYVALRPAR
jgi:FkbM family methyltransferase